MLQELAPRACGGAAGSGFSLLFPMAGGQFGYGCEDGGGQQVDCTLSLGTPSTRRAQEGVHGRTAAGVSWQDSGGRGLPAARRCANCDTTSTPLWRNGPRGPKSLCNACGIRYKKEERRAAAAVAPATTQDTGLVGSYACGAAYARQHQPPPQWGRYGSSLAKSASFAAYGDAAGADGSWMLNVMPSSPAFAVGERPTLFQYYY